MWLDFVEMDRPPNPDNVQEEFVMYGMDGGGPGKEVQVAVQPNRRRSQSA